MRTFASRCELSLKFVCHDNENVKVRLVSLLIEEFDVPSDTIAGRESHTKYS